MQFSGGCVLHLNGLVVFCTPYCSIVLEGYAWGEAGSIGAGMLVCVCV